jgi:hypothetical protein
MMHGTMNLKKIMLATRFPSSGKIISVTVQTNLDTMPLSFTVVTKFDINPLNAELNSICHLLALLGAHPILHVSRIRVKINTEF